MKKINILICIVIIACLGIIIFHKNENTILLGDTVSISCDVNGDNKVNVYDYLIVKKHILKLQLLTGDNLKRADVNDDGNINITDILKIKKTILNGPVSKTVTATFTIQDAKGVTASDITRSCTIKDGENGCEITSPTLSAKNGYTAIGWNTNKNSAKAILNSNSKVLLKENIEYFSISKNNTELVAKFEIVLESSKEGNNKKCYLYNGSDNCSITAPLLIANSGYEAVGWSTNKNNPENLITSGGKGTISKNTTFYSVVKKPITVNFSVNDNISNSDITKSNIKAEKLSFYKTSCNSYNNNGCKITWIPTVYSSGNYVYGFSKTKTGSTIEVAKTVFKEDTTLYARVYNYYNHEDYKIKHVDVQYTKTYGNIVVEMQNTISAEGVAHISNFLDMLYREKPQFFYFNGKIIIADKDTYDSMIPLSSGGMAMGTSVYKVIYVRYYDEIMWSSGRTITHELGHAYDYEMGKILGTMIRERTEVQELYNKYSKLEPANRPLRDYAYTNIGEFIAETYASSLYRYLNENRIYYNYNGKIVPYYNNYPDSNPVNDALYEIYNNVNNEALEYYKKIGRIK